MEHQLGRISIVSWQDRRFHDAQRVDTVSVILTVAVVASALLLGLRFVAGTPLPLELLQIAFAVLVASGALLLMRAIVGAILRRQRS